MTRSLRHIALILSIIFGFTLTDAETVSQKEASRIAEKFFNAAAGQIMAKPKLVFNGKRFTTNRLFTPFYVYNHPAGGSVIISAENKAMPILGYSLKSTFSPDHIDQDQMKLLSEYARDIEYIRYDSRIPNEAIEAWGDIADCIDYTLNRFYRDDHFDRLENDDTVWIMRRNATEFPEIGNLQTNEGSEDEPEDVPFSFYEDFVAETRAEQQRRLDMFDAKINIVEPKLRWIGGGHFEAQLPEQISMVRLYNMEGALIRELTFRNTDTAVFDLDSEPHGFYFALINDINGKPYGFKLCK